MASEIAPGPPQQPVADDRPDPIKPRKAPDDTEMDITPMIDITFLLLIFFLVASKMDESTAVPLPSTKTGMNVPVKESIFITVAEGNSDATAAVYQGAGAAAGKELDYSSVEALEAAIIEYVQQEVLDDQKKKWVVIKGAKDVKYKHINEVAKAAAAVEEITNMAVAVTQEN